MTDRNSCYALEAALSVAAPRDELGQEAMRTWLAGFRGMKLQDAVPRLIVKLDRMSRVLMSVSGRRSVLRRIEPLLLKVAAALPKAVGPLRAQQEGDGYKPLLEQRLYCLMVKNLKQVLRDVHSSRDGAEAQDKTVPVWAADKLFLFLGKQIELGLFRGLPIPEHTWQELHDLYAYVVDSEIAPSGAGNDRGSEDFNPQSEYKRLLLLGLAGRLVQNRTWSDLVQEKMASWVADTRLEPPEAFVGQADLYVVDSSKDAAPRQLRSALEESFRGWVLIRTTGFLSDEIAPRDDAGNLAPPSVAAPISQMH